jgi:hypothetical protein
VCSTLIGCVCSAGTAHLALKRKASLGGDGMTWQQYGEALKANLSPPRNQVRRRILTWRGPHRRHRPGRGIRPHEMQRPRWQFDVLPAAAPCSTLAFTFHSSRRESIPFLAADHSLTMFYWSYLFRLQQSPIVRTARSEHPQNCKDETGTGSRCTEFHPVRNGQLRYKPTYAARNLADLRHRRLRR